jgi:hypothetical protein
MADSNFLFGDPGNLGLDKLLYEKIKTSERDQYHTSTTANKSNLISKQNDSKFGERGTGGHGNLQPIKVKSLNSSSGNNNNGSGVPSSPNFCYGSANNTNNGQFNTNLSNCSKDGVALNNNSFFNVYDQRFKTQLTMSSDGINMMGSKKWSTHCKLINH